jgi:hypothetical protein
MPLPVAERYTERIPLSGVKFRLGSSVVMLRASRGRVE